MKTLFLSVSLLLVSWLGPEPVKTPAPKPSLVKKWETEAVFRIPESVCFDARKNVLYVSNIDGKPDEKDGKGFISKLSPDGRIQQLEWVRGLDAPKGMALLDGLLYVADLANVVIIDTQTGKVKTTITVEGAEFLNDVTVSKEGDIFISDSNKHRVYRVENRVVSPWLENADWQNPNGLLVDGKNLDLLDMDAGIFYKINRETKEVTKFAEGVASGDGLVPVGDGYLASNWNGEVSYVSKDGAVEKLLDTQEQKINAADIEYIPSKKLLLVPTFFANKVVAYEFR